MPCGRLGASLAATPAEAALIDVQFGATTPTPSTLFSGAAVVGASGDIWNYSQSPTASGSALKDTSGASTGVSISYSEVNFGGAWGLSGNGGGDAMYGTKYWPLMQSFLYSYGPAGSGISVQFTGLMPGETYTLDILDQVQTSGTYGSILTVNGQAAGGLQNQQSASTLINNVNYTVFSGVVGANGQINLFSAIGNGDTQTQMNGIQLSVSGISGGVPEAPTYWMALLGFLGLAMVGARRARA